METYIISAEEVMWGSLLVAITMGVHGSGMLVILRINRSLNERIARQESFAGGLGTIILCSLLIILVSLLEVNVWAGFFLLRGAQPNHSVAVYNALLNYTTLQAGYLPQRWHLLEALLAMAGLITFAWSTSILYVLAQDFQDTQLRKGRREKQAKPTPKPERDAAAERDGG